jgi:FLVCR family feline leukemia virus subgroup C receptor-related protein
MNSSGEFNKTFLTTQVKPQQTKLYKRRWLILCLYILYAAINAFQWFEYSIITNVVMKFYNVSAVAVDWTSIIYMALYMPMVIPVSYLMEIIVIINFRNTNL